MKANLINSFAAGLLVSAGVSGIVYFSQSTPKESIDQESVKAPTEEEMKMSLSDAGYIILTDAEWDEQLATLEKEAEAKVQQTQKEQTEQSEQQDNGEVVYRTIVNVASGMTSIDVGNALVHGKIIDNAMTFFNEVEKRGLANDLKPGTFELDSNMTLDEVIKTIFK
ncbi:hypothetical protein [Robertmurraya massiliosenegalensis]|uniref:hypothetical protein n=1 Tax=Robertmurraya massiliosenegalensis TaxID=1287657 RepID=UPI000313AAAF|nr:hypothetical protein [Robertmurraya massiliosenegalensis]